MIYYSYSPRPRILADKKKKGTGRPDLTRQEALDKEMSGMALVTFSGRTCALARIHYTK